MNVSVADFNMHGCMQCCMGVTAVCGCDHASQDGATHEAARAIGSECAWGRESGQGSMRVCLHGVLFFRREGGDQERR